MGQKREDKALGTSRPAERLARREKQANDAAKTGEERDAKAEEKVFDIGLTRDLILSHKVALENWVRTDKDIYEAVDDWREDPVAAERRYGHISDWDVSRVTRMTRLFYVNDESDKHNFDEDLSRWQTGNVTNMSMMFWGASSFDSDLSQWQTGNVTDMEMMFFGASSFTSDLSKWQTGNVTDMSEMFSGARSLQEKPSWCTSWIPAHLTD